jgi:hypothetical protein
MPLSEKAIDFLEQHIPEQAVMALKLAYLKALASGSSVLICEGEYLIEQFLMGPKKSLRKFLHQFARNQGKMRHRIKDNIPRVRMFAGLNGLGKTLLNR